MVLTTIHRRNAFWWKVTTWQKCCMCYFGLFDALGAQSIKWALFAFHTVKPLFHWTFWRRDAPWPQQAFELKWQLSDHLRVQRHTSNAAGKTFHGCKNLNWSNRTDAKFAKSETQTSTVAKYWIIICISSVPLSAFLGKSTIAELFVKQLDTKKHGR